MLRFYFGLVNYWWYPAQQNKNNRVWGHQFYSANRYCLVNGEIGFFIFSSWGTGGALKSKKQQ